MYIKILFSKEKCRVFKKLLEYIVLALGLFLLLIMLEKSFSNWLFSTKLSSMFEVFENQNLFIFAVSSLFSFLLILLIFSQYYYNKLKLNFLILLLLVTFIYLIYVRFSGNYTFYLIPFSKLLSYYDLILLLPFSLLIMWRIINHLISNGDFLHKNKPSTFITDYPIKSYMNDSLGRNDYAKHITNKIILNNNTDSSIGIAITGSWGSGKTSFLELVKENIADRAIVFWFKPWLYPNNLSENFIEELVNAITANNTLSRLRLKLKVSKIITGDRHWLIWMKNFIFSNNSLKQQLTELSQIIKTSIKNKIIVLLDDLDRLSSNEITEFFRLMRNIGDLPNTYFIVGFDKDYINSTLKKHFGVKTDLYLEKFFQQEIPLSNYKSDYIKALFKFEIEKISKEKGVNLLFDDYFKNSDFGVFKSKRHINKFLNGFCSLKEIMKFKIDFPSDLLYLEFIRYSLPSIFFRLFENIEENFNITVQNFVVYNEKTKKLINNDNVSSVFTIIFKETDKKRISFKHNLVFYLSYCQFYIYDFILPLNNAIKSCSSELINYELSKLINLSNIVTNLSYKNEIQYFFKELDFDNENQLNTFRSVYDNFDNKTTGFPDEIHESIERGKRKFNN